jgi:hypothetical protein
LLNDENWPFICEHDGILANIIAAKNKINVFHDFDRRYFSNYRTLELYPDLVRQLSVIVDLPKFAQLINAIQRKANFEIHEGVIVFSDEAVRPVPQHSEGQRPPRVREEQKQSTPVSATPKTTEESRKQNKRKAESTPSRPSSFSNEELKDRHERKWYLEHIRRLKESDEYAGKDFYAAFFRDHPKPNTGNEGRTEENTTRTEPRKRPENTSGRFRRSQK